SSSPPAVAQLRLVRPAQQMETQRSSGRKHFLKCGAVFALLCTNAVPAMAEDFPLKRFKPLTYVVDYEPFWSPDGRQIVLISSRHGGMKVHVMDASSLTHGSDMRQLTTGDAEDASIAPTRTHFDLSFRPPALKRWAIAKICAKLM